MSHLLVDIGNSGVKSAVASCGAIVSSCREKLVGDSTAGLGLACGISRGIYSSVRELSDEEMSVLDSFAFLVHMIRLRHCCYVVQIKRSMSWWVGNGVCVLVKS